MGEQARQISPGGGQDAVPAAEKCLPGIFLQPLLRGEGEEMKAAEIECTAGGMQGAVDIVDQAGQVLFCERSAVHLEKRAGRLGAMGMDILGKIVLSRAHGAGKKKRSMGRNLIGLGKERADFGTAGQKAGRGKIRGDLENAQGLSLIHI